MKVQGSKVEDYKSPSSILTGEDGLRYDQQSRELLEPLVGEESMRRLEMFAAARWFSRRMHDYITAWAEGHGLSESRFHILMQLTHEDSVPLSKLAARLRVTPRAVTALVDQLENDGMVVRIADRQDRRTVRAQLTSEGRELFAKIWKEYLQIPLDLAGDVPQDRLDTIRSTCLELIEKIDQSQREAKS